MPDFPPDSYSGCGCNDNKQSILQKIQALLLALGEVVTNNLRIISSVLLGKFTEVDTFNVQTNATGANYQALPANTATAFRINNDTGTAIEIRKVAGSSTTPEIIADKTSATYPVAANINEWEIRRQDQSNTQVTLTGTYVKL